MYFQYLIIRATVHATEDEEKVREAIDLIAPDTREFERTETLEGHHHNTILLLERKISKRGRVNKIMDGLKKDGILHTIEDEIEKRIDETTLYFRVSKEKAADGELCLARGKEETIAVKVKIAAYPAKKEIAVNKIKEWFNEIKA